MSKLGERMKNVNLWLLGCMLTATVHAQKNAVIGKAEIYSPSLHGTAIRSSKDLIDSNALTCAYNNAALGQKVRVVNLEANPAREVLLTVNDSGPFPEGFIITLTAAAARNLGIKPGETPRVTVELYNPPVKKDEKPLLYSASPKPGSATSPPAAQTAKGAAAQAPPNTASPKSPAAQTAKGAAAQAPPNTASPKSPAAQTAKGAVAQAPPNTASPKSPAAQTAKGAVAQVPQNPTVVSSNLYTVSIKSQDRVGYAVQVGAYQNAGALLEEIKNLEKRYSGQTLVAAIHEQKGVEKQVAYKLLIGPFANEKEADAARAKLSGIGYKKCFKVNLGTL
ncbi:MAG: SPOR domain-containing protein [Saprospiraceae bacterium]